MTFQCSHMRQGYACEARCPAGLSSRTTSNSEGCLLACHWAMKSVSVTQDKCLLISSNPSDKESTWTAKCVKSVKI